MRDQNLPFARHEGWTETEGGLVNSADGIGIPAWTNRDPWRHTNRIDNFRYLTESANNSKVSEFRHLGVKGLSFKVFKTGFFIYKLTFFLVSI